MTNNIKEHIESIEKFGFKKVLEVPFECDDNSDTFYVFFLEEYGILLEFDAYGGKSVNGGNFYYEWIPENDHAVIYTSTGGFHKVNEQNIWIGSHDCRDHPVSDILGLASAGKFVTPWVCTDHFTSPKFVHYGDHHTDINESWNAGYKKYKDACKNQGRERSEALPEYVKKSIEIGYIG